MPTIGHCKDCRWWTRSTYVDRRGVGSSFGDCACSKFLAGSAGWGTVAIYLDHDGAMAYKPESEVADAIVRGTGYADGDAGFSTGQDFGCIHWQTADANPVDTAAAPC